MQSMMVDWIPGQKKDMSGDNWQNLNMVCRSVALYQC